MTRSENLNNHEELGRLTRFVKAIHDEPFPERDFRKSEENLRGRVGRAEERRPWFFIDLGLWMRYRVALAGLCVLALVFVYVSQVHFGDEGNTAFAEILKRIGSVRSYRVTGRMVSPDEDIVFSQFYTERGNKSVREDIGLVVIEDDSIGKTYVIDERERTVTIRDVPTKGAGRLPINDWLAELAEVKGVVSSNEILDGSPVLCFRYVNPARADKPFSSTHTYWFDEVTHLPVKISNQQSNGVRGTHEDYVFSEEEDNSIFDRVIPEGYTVIESEGPSVSAPVAPEGPTEHEFIWGVWEIAKRNEKVFPSSITVREVNRLWPNPEGEAENLAKSQALRACLFIQGEDVRDFHYAGEGIPTGGRETPICWWRVGGSEEYRMLFATCEVKTLTKTELDSLVAAR